MVDEGEELERGFSRALGANDGGRAGTKRVFGNTFIFGASGWIDQD